MMCSDGAKRLSTNEAIRCTMLCFCDIPPVQLDIHMAKYGPFGVAFPKRFLLRHGATPVYYVPGNARNQTIGVGPQNVAARFDDLHAELQEFRNDLERYVSRIEGTSPVLMDTRPFYPSFPRQIRQRAIDFAAASRGCKVNLKSSFSHGLHSSRKDFRRTISTTTTWNANGDCMTMGSPSV